MSLYLLYLLTPSEPAPVLADRGELEQVVMNLAVNARDAMPGGGTLRLSVRPVELDEAFCRSRPWAEPGPWVALAVADTGEGMDEATRNRIFEPFFTTKESGKGTGLGLATVYRIVTSHHGMIEVDSAPGRGTTFTVYLPAAAPGEESAGEKDAAPGAGSGVERGGGRTILVAEDEPEVSQTIGEVLQSAGYRVLRARDGEHALELFRRHGDEIAAALLDVRMPGRSGPEVGRALRRTRPGLPIVFMSGFTAAPGEQKEDVPEGPRLAFLQKPFSGARLLETLGRVLNPPPDPFDPDGSHR